MPKFRTRPSHRKQRAPRAAQLVLGIKRAAAVDRGAVTAHVLPARGGDHRKRYAAGQRLAIKGVVGISGMSETVCHVILTAVHGPGDSMTAGQIGYRDAKMLGHETLSEFRTWWIKEHDADWLAAQNDPPLADILARFEHRWDGKLIWALHFSVDMQQAPRLLAARSEELYTDVPARALKHELPALSAAEYDEHVAKRRDATMEEYAELEREARLAQQQSMTLGQRLDLAIAEARAQGLSTTREVRVIERRLQALEEIRRRPAA